MRIVAFSILFIVGFLAGVLAHPVHFSVTNMEYEHDSASLNYSLRVFYDDFQALINYKYNLNLDFSMRNRLTSNEQAAILDYLSRAFQLMDGKSNILAVDFSGWKLEDESVWLFFCATIPSGIDKLEVRNTLMLDLFDDQFNLVIYENKGMQSGYEFDRRNTARIIELK